MDAPCIQPGTRGAAPLDLGALEHSLGDCDTTRPPIGPMLPPGQDGGLDPSDDGGWPPNPLGDAGGNGASPTSGGCGCETVRSSGGSLGAVAALGLLLARRRSRGRRALRRRKTLGVERHSDLS